MNMKVSLICFIFVLITNKSPKNGDIKSRTECTNEGHARSECTRSSELSAETKLRKTLFCNYNKMVRPVKYFDNQTLVRFQLYPAKISMNEHQEVIEFEGNILYVWTDTFLKWDPREYEGLDYIRVSSNEIWVPDITVDTWSHTTTIASMAADADCHLAHMGNVYCFLMTTLEAPCTPDITAYPFDTQNCTLTFSSPGFVGKYVNFTLLDPKNGIKMILYRPNKVWELKSATARRHVQYYSVEDKSAFYPLIRCNFMLQRHSSGLVAILIVPAAVLAGLTLLTFWMDTMYTTRIGIAATIILSDVFYCTYLGMMLPSNGDRIPVIVTFYRDSFVLASFSIVVTIFVRHLQTKTSSSPHWMMNMLTNMESIPVVQFVFLGEKFRKEEDSVEIIETSKKNVTVWDQMATFVDRISFILCCLTYGILLIFYLP